MGGDALAAARFADDAQRLARVHVEAHAVDGLDRSLIGHEVRLQIAHRQQRLVDHFQTPYGSAASRRPSPRKLNARIATVTGMAGSSSHGETAAVCTLEAAWSMTPQDSPGGRMPSPRKLSDVSKMMIAGNASVVAAMMWLMNDGTR